ncbi:MAG: YciI family protein [Opitutaceae bacterium]|nr:YciI family protein [Opitutaceae bacterium]
MHYALLIYRDDIRWSALSTEERDRIWDEAQRLADDTVKRGQFVAGAALHAPATATTVRMNHQKTVVTDGPFAETKEVLAGFLLIDCPSLDDALKVAARVPVLRIGGSVEVRPVGSRCE